MDVYDIIDVTVVDAMKEFLSDYKKEKPDADPVEMFKAVIRAITEDDRMKSIIAQAMTDDICDDNPPISDRIQTLFSLLFAEYELTKIEFIDSARRKNFINYEVVE
jgi:hypothetical protein